MLRGAIGVRELAWALGAHALTPYVIDVGQP